MGADLLKIHVRGAQVLYHAPHADDIEATASEILTGESPWMASRPSCPARTRPPRGLHRFPPRYRNCVGRGRRRSVRAPDPNQAPMPRKGRGIPPVFSSEDRSLLCELADRRGSRRTRPRKKYSFPYRSRISWSASSVFAKTRKQLRHLAIPGQ